MAGKYHFFTLELCPIFGVIYVYDGEHMKARFSVSTGVKIENFMKVKTKKYHKQMIDVYHIKYFIAKFA